MVSDTIKSSKSIVPILIIPVEILNQKQIGAIQMMEQILSYFGENWMDCQDSILIGLTKLESNNSIQKIRFVIAETKKFLQKNTQSEEQKKKYIQILDFFASCLKNKKPNIFIIDPLEPNKRKGLLELISKTKKIENEKHLIHYQVSKEHRKEFFLTLGNLEKKINNFLREEKFGRIFIELNILSTILFYLEEYKEKIEKILTSLKSTIENHLQKKTKETLQNFENLLDRGCGITTENLDFIIKHLHQLDKISYLSKYLSKVIFEKDNFLQKFVETLEDYYSKISFDNVKQFSTDLNTLKLIDEKFSSHTSEITEIYNLKISEFKEYLKKKQHEFVNSLPINHFSSQKCNSSEPNPELLNNMKNSSIHLENHSENVMNIYKDTINHLKSCLKNLLLFELEEISETDCQKIVKNYANFKKFKSAHQDHLSNNEDLDETSFIERIVSICLKIIEEIHQILTQTNITSKEITSSTLNILQILSDSDPTIKKKLESQKIQLQKKLEEKIKQVSRIDEIFSLREIDVEVALENYELLNRLKYLDHYFCGVVENLINEYNHKIARHLTFISKKIQNNCKDSNIPEIIKNFEKILSYEELVQLIVVENENDYQKSKQLVINFIQDRNLKMKNMRFQNDRTLNIVNNSILIKDFEEYRLFQTSNSLKSICRDDLLEMNQTLVEHLNQQVNGFKNKLVLIEQPNFSEISEAFKQLKEFTKLFEQEFLVNQDISSLSSIYEEKKIDMENQLSKKKHEIEKLIQNNNLLDAQKILSIYLENSMILDNYLSSKPSTYFYECSSKLGNGKREILKEFHNFHRHEKSSFSIQKKS